MVVCDAHSCCISGLICKFSTAAISASRYQICLDLRQENEGSYLSEGEELPVI